MELQIIHKFVDLKHCNMMVKDCARVTHSAFLNWSVNRPHIPIPTDFPYLTALLHDQLGFPLVPHLQMALRDPPGCGGMRPHPHDTDGCLFYPKTHACPLLLRPVGALDSTDAIEVPIKAGMLVLIPKGMWHHVGPNTTKETRYCIPTLYKERL